MTDPTLDTDSALDPTDAVEALRASLKPEIVKALESLGIDLNGAHGDAQPQSDATLQSLPVGFVLDGLPYPMRVALRQMVPAVNASLAGLGVSVLFDDASLTEPDVLLALGHAYLHLTNRPVSLLLEAPVTCPHTEGRSSQ